MSLEKQNKKAAVDIIVPVKLFIETVGANSHGRGKKSFRFVFLLFFKGMFSIY